MATLEIDATAMSRPTFATALMGALPGTAMIYYRGDLVTARRRSEHVKDLAEEAWSLWETGWAYLGQRRIRGHENNFEYLAIKRTTFERAHP